MAEADHRSFDQVVAEEGAGKGHEPVVGPGLEDAEAGGVRSKMGDHEELLPEIEAV